MEWDPSRFFHPQGSSSPYALLILNQPINEKAFGVLSRYGKFLYEFYIDTMS
jgi:thiamine pyrophosphokinase